MSTFTRKGTMLSSIIIVCVCGQYVCVVPVRVWVDLSYGSADRDRCTLSIPIIHTVPPLNSNLLTSHPKTLPGHTETLNWAKLWEWGASSRWPETHSIKKATSLASNLGPLLHFSCHFAVCYLIKAIHQAAWDTEYMCVYEKTCKEQKGKEIKASEQTWGGRHPEIHFSLSIWLCVWVTDCQLRTTWSSDNCLHWHSVTHKKRKNRIK